MADFAKPGYSITPSMPAYSMAALQEELQEPATSSTLLLVAFLRSHEDEHGGAFTRATRGLRHAVDKLVSESPALKCVLGQRANVHVLHDQPHELASWRTGVTLTRLTPIINIPSEAADATHPHNRRWIEYAALLADASWHPEAECVWLIDLTDVRVVRLPPCAALQQSSPERLWVGSDVMSSRGSFKEVKRWLWSKAVATGFNTTMSDKRAWREWRMNPNAAPCNSGIVGGVRSAVVPALQKFAADVRALKAAFPHRRVGAGVDMLLWNDQCLRGARPPASLGTGYPHGPLNLPMSAQVRTESGRWCTEACRHNYLRSVRGLFWFMHKAPLTWARLAAPSELSADGCTSPSAAAASSSADSASDDHESRGAARLAVTEAAASAVEREPRQPFLLEAALSLSCKNQSGCV
jgi:hypothetical protein